jgi:hypothetical protein
MDAPLDHAISPTVRGLVQHDLDDSEIKMIREDAERPVDLYLEYETMAKDQAREAEAVAWADALLPDVGDEDA